ncbi:MAG: efflux RND transporter periplasmic adaptor subunit [Methylohalobius sp.]|nr:efflux RND transporter periplasmic adaptor subunit [Methylohalobius sp.]
MALLVLAGLAVLVYFGWRQHAKEANEFLILYGHIDLRQLDLAPGVAERIAKMHFWEGDKVSAGELMAELTPTRFKTEVERLQAQIAAQEAIVAKLTSGSRSQEIRKAKALLTEAKAQEKLAALTYQRLAKLLPQKLISAEEADSAQAKLDAARARRQIAEETLSLALEGPRREDIAAARATLAAYRAQLRLAEKNLLDTKLYAPASGVVQNRLAEPGDIASPQRPIYTLALTDPLWARVYVSEPDLGKIRPGMAAFLETDSFPRKRYAGWVGYISPVAEFTPHAVQTEEVRTKLVYQVRVYACDPQGELRLGMPVVVKIPLAGPVPTGLSSCR